MTGLFSAVGGVGWLRFVSEYAGDSGWIPTWVWWVLTAGSVAFGLLVAINPGGLVISEIAVDQFGLFAFPTESAGLITEMHDRQPFAEDQPLEHIRTRHQFARYLYDSDLETLTREQRLDVERHYHDQFADD